MTIYLSMLFDVHFTIPKETAPQLLSKLMSEILDNICNAISVSIDSCPDLMSENAPLGIPGELPCILVEKIDQLNPTIPNNRIEVVATIRICTQKHSETYDIIKDSFTRSKEIYDIRDIKIMDRPNMNDIPWHITKDEMQPSVKSKNKCKIVKNHSGGKWCAITAQKDEKNLVSELRKFSKKWAKLTGHDYYRVLANFREKWTDKGILGIPFVLNQDIIDGIRIINHDKIRTVCVTRKIWNMDSRPCISQDICHIIKYKGERINTFSLLKKIWLKSQKL